MQIICLIGLIVEIRQKNGPLTDELILVGSTCYAEQVRTYAVEAFDNE